MLLVQTAQISATGPEKTSYREPEREQAIVVTIFNLRPLQLLACKIFIRSTIPPHKGITTDEIPEGLLSLFRAWLQGVLPRKSDRLSHDIVTINTEMFGPDVGRTLDDDFNVTIAFNFG